MSEKHVPKALAGKTAILAQRYALALLELAEEKGQTDAVLADLDALGEAITGSRDFTLMSTHPRFHSEKTCEVIKQIAASAKLNEITTSFLMRVAINRRLALLDHMIDAFREEFAELRGQSTALVTAACALSQAQRTELVAQLSKLMGGTVDIIVREDKSLLGGLMVKFGSRLIDASVKGKLAQIERQLKTQREAA